MYKKIIAMAILVSVIPFLGASAQGGEKKMDLPLEKISSLSEVRYYSHITKKDGSLWGVRKDGKGSSTPMAKEDRKLEKISSLGELKKFEDVRKVGNALWGYMKKEYRLAIDKMKMKAYRPVEAGQVTCVNTALDTKDQALMGANSTHLTEINAALSARNTCQKAAIAIASSSEQQKAVEACVKTFHESAKTAREKNKTAHETIWKTFRSSLKTCAPNTASGSPEMIIEDGGNGLSE